MTQNLPKIDLIFVFKDPDIERLDQFIAQLKSLYDNVSNISVGVIGDASYHADTVSVFTDNTSISQAFNQLAALSTADVLILNQGVILPIISESSWDAIAGIRPSSFVALDGRRTVGEIEEGVRPRSVAQWGKFEFSRNVHADSPLAYAVRRDDFLQIRGFDERKTFQTVRTMDLLARLRRFGSFPTTIDDEDTYALDVRSAFPVIPLAAIPDSVSVRENEKAQVHSDASIYRNLENWSVPKKERPVLVSVAIATRDRGDYLTDSINSVLAQSFEEFELIIVDDGSEDNTREVVESYQDERVRYFRQDPLGISSARNLAADNSLGYFTAVHDDDDMMLPWRLATSLAALTGTEQASYGSWVNFDDVTGEMALHITKEGFGRDLVAFSGQTPGHATWLLPTAMIQCIRYDESLSSSVDHNIAVRTIMSGLRWKHSGKVLFLRRLHPTQVSQTDSRRQRAAAVLTRYVNSFSADIEALRKMTDAGKALKFPNPADKNKLFQQFGAYLPDHLVLRSMRIQGLVGKKVLALDLHDRFAFIASETDLLTDKSTLELGGAEGIVWDDIVEVRRQGLIGCTYTAERRTAAGSFSSADNVSDVQSVANDQLIRAFKTVQAKNSSAVLLTLQLDGLSKELLIESPGIVLARHFSINYGQFDRKRFIAIGFKSYDLAVSFVRENNSIINGLEIHLNGHRNLELCSSKLFEVFSS